MEFTSDKKEELVQLVKGLNNDRNIIICKTLPPLTYK